MCLKIVLAMFYFEATFYFESKSVRRWLWIF